MSEVQDIETLKSPQASVGPGGAGCAKPELHLEGPGISLSESHGTSHNDVNACVLD